MPVINNVKLRDRADCTVKPLSLSTLAFEPSFIVHATLQSGTDVPARSNLSCSKYTNEIHVRDVHARSGRSK